MVEVVKSIAVSEDNDDGGREEKEMGSTK